MDPYDRLVWEVWMPRMRSLVLSWSPRLCDPMVHLVEAWKPLLPGWVLENILEQLILPKIQAEQEAWDPTTDIMPVHKWIHPWLPLMGLYCLGEGEGEGEGRRPGIPPLTSCLYTSGSTPGYHSWVCTAWGRGRGSGRGGGLGSHH